VTAVEEVARTPRLLVALDFDGTLSPLVDEPMTARAAPEAKAALAALVEAPDTVVALVSGRSLNDLRVISEHDDDSRILLAGSHGAEYWVPADVAFESPDADDPAERELRDRLHAQVEELASSVAGVWVEPKTFGFGVHTRTAEDAAAATALRDEADRIVAAEAPGWRRREGHNLVEYASRTEGKDAGVARLRELTGATAVVFAGDDVTDEDALRTLGDGDLGIRVGGGETAASVRVDDIAGLAELLMTLAHARSASRQ
jgi:trehalose 6-phosphate phosphatase